MHIPPLCSPLAAPPWPLRPALPVPPSCPLPLLMLPSPLASRERYVQVGSGECPPAAAAAGRTPPAGRAGWNYGPGCRLWQQL
jgi:hypothetical protein